MPERNLTIVLVHGAFADASGWYGVIPKLKARGYNVIAPPNPLRSIKTDAASVAGLLASIKGPIVLVGHSYGGAVITNAAQGSGNVKALVYVDGFALDEGESAASISDHFPGDKLVTALAPPVPLPDGGQDLYISEEKFHAQFAADVPADLANLMFVTQRPLTVAAVTEASGPPAWKTIPSWFIYGSADKAIPLGALELMAKRANPREIVVIDGGSHVVMVSQPDAVAALILRAAQAVAEVQSDTATAK
jgi:pimeloyl-ACP methyl ester carboxylesterase